MTSNGNSSSGGSSGIGMGGALFLVFLVLKLTHVIDWSWWWITAPLWGGLVLALVIFGVVFLAITISRSRRKTRMH